jgi:hypothetical protein
MFPMMPGTRAVMVSVVLFSGCAIGSVRSDPPAPPGLVKAITLIAQSRQALVENATVVVRADLLDAFDELTPLGRDSLLQSLGPRYRMDLPSTARPCGSTTDTMCVVWSLTDPVRHRDTLRIRSGWKGFVRGRCGAGYEATFVVVAGPDGPSIAAVEDEDHTDCGARP